MKHLALLALMWVGIPTLAYYNLWAGIVVFWVFVLAIDRRRFVGQR